MRGLVFAKLVAMTVGGLLCGGFTALPIETVANRSRTDTVANDGKGGWLDLGANDLSVLPTGHQVFAGVPFAILPSGDENARNCLVLGLNGPGQASLELSDGVSEQCLYLLHATTDSRLTEPNGIGEVVLRFADGSSVTNAVRFGENAADWMSGRGCANAARAWSEYNGASQASLYVTSFDLKHGAKLCGLAFRAAGTRPWMVLAATATDRVQIRPLGRKLDITEKFRSPRPPSKPLTRFAPGCRPKNVILVIGDGMGQGAARLASYYKYGASDALYFNRFPVAGLCSTLNVSGGVTDSAAASTAIATGMKTSNGRLGLTADGHSVTSVAVRASAKGLGVAVMTSDSIWGATPSGFYAHVAGRSARDLICACAAGCGFDMLIGKAGSIDGFRPKAAGGLREDGRDILAEMETRGYRTVSTQRELETAPPGVKVVGGIDLDGDTAIADAMRASIVRLANAEKGFFMMAECTATDYGGHRNNPELTVRAVTQVEFMAEAAVDFAAARGDTLVVVTADHETGGVQVVRGSGGEMVADYTTTSHTATPVPVYAYGPGAERLEGLIDNTDVAKAVASLLDL